MDFTWRDFFTEVNTTEYHSQRQKKVAETIKKIKVLGEVVEFGSTSKGLAISRPDFDLFLIFDIDPYYCSVNKTISADLVIPNHLLHDVFFKEIKRILKAGMIDFPSFAYTPVAPIQGSGQGKMVQIEITPAIRIVRNNQLSHFLLIPSKSKNHRSWIATDALTENARLINLNKLFPNFKNFVRVWKTIMAGCNPGLTSRQILSLMGSWTAMNIHRFPKFNLDCFKFQAKFFLTALETNQYSDFAAESVKKFPNVRLIRDSLRPVFQNIIEAQNLDQVVKFMSKF